MSRTDANGRGTRLAINVAIVMRMTCPVTTAVILGHPSFCLVMHSLGPVVVNTFIITHFIAPMSSAVVAALYPTCHGMAVIKSTLRVGICNLRPSPTAKVAPPPHNKWARALVFV